QAEAAEKRQAEAEKRQAEFDAKLEKQRAEFEEEMKKSREAAEKSTQELNKKIAGVTDTLGNFAVEMVEPKLMELLRAKGIPIETIYESIKGFKNDQRYYEVDLLMVNTNIFVAVEVKTTLKPEDVDEHIERLEKIKAVGPKGMDLSGMSFYGAIAGMVVKNDADIYACKKGLYVLCQNGENVKVVNDSKFQPRTWKTDY
ncbi:MAG: small VCP/p97-interacting protein, partial [Chitinophagaceae bacterium]|nr:small VCP/p97-interacting protein [Chitinophagaceae bacterium]